MKIKEILAEIPELETERLLLRKMCLADVEDIFEYASVPAVSQYTTWEPHKSIEDSQRFLKATIEGYNQHDIACWGIVEKAGKKFIGACGFAEWRVDCARGEIGYVLSDKYWGNGYMREAVRAMMGFGFRTMQLNRIEGRCMVENTASARVMEKAGMKFEGVLRQHLFAKGIYHDVKMYSILRQEWIE